MWPLTIGTILNNTKNKYKLVFSIIYSLIILFLTLLTNSKDTLISLFMPIIFLFNQSFFKLFILGEGIEVEEKNFSPKNLRTPSIFSKVIISKEVHLKVHGLERLVRLNLCQVLFLNMQLILTVIQR